LYSKCSKLAFFRFAQPVFAPPNLVHDIPSKDCFEEKWRRELKEGCKGFYLGVVVAPHVGGGDGNIQVVHYEVLTEEGQCLVICPSAGRGRGGE